MNRVLLVEDHVSFGDSLALVLGVEPDLEVCGRATTMREARKLIGGGVDVAVVDLGLPDGDGTALIREIHEANPETRVLVLTASIERERIAHAVEAGAAGVVHKSAGVLEIVDAMRRLAVGEALLEPEEVLEYLRIAGRARERLRQEQLAITRLTPRELQVLRALAEGLNSAEISRRLEMSVETERTHIVNILKKLKVHSRLEAVVFAVRHGVVEIQPVAPYYG
jgi:DNA-binding NarL/FixJ family response regulator